MGPHRSHMIREHEPYVIEEAEPHEEEGNSPVPQLQQPARTDPSESSPDQHNLSGHFLQQQQPPPSSEGQGSSPPSTANNMRSQSRTSKSRKQLWMEDLMFLKRELHDIKQANQRASPT